MQSAQIINYILSSLRLNEDNKDKDSYYGEYKLGGGELLVIRISNHRTYLSTWDERYKPTQQANSKVMRRMGRNLPDIFRKKIFYSFVFEDEFDTVGSMEVPSKRKIVVLENVYKSSNFNLQSLNAFKDGLIQLTRNGQYNANIFGQYQIVSNRNDSALFILKNVIEESVQTYFKDLRSYQYLLLNEYNQNNCNRNMRNKQVVRLTEEKLHSLIRESIRSVLNEHSVYDQTFSIKFQSFYQQTYKQLMYMYQILPAFIKSQMSTNNTDLANVGSQMQEALKVVCECTDALFSYFELQSNNQNVKKTPYRPQQGTQPIQNQQNMNGQINYQQ